MDGFVSVIFAVLPPLLLLFIGAMARKMKWLRAEADTSLSMITLIILYPSFIIHHILNSNVSLDSTTVILPLYGFLSIVLGFCLAWVVSMIFGLSGKELQTFRFCSGIFNYGFIAIPVAMALFESEIVVHIILFNLGVEIAIWTIGIFVLTNGKLKFKGFINPPIVSVFIALIIQETIGFSMIPVFIWEVVKSLGNCAIPIGLILIGGSFYQLFKGFNFSQKCKVEVASVMVRNIIFPVIVLSFLLVGLLPNEIDWLREILVVQSAMPAGIFAVVVVGNYEGDKMTALRSIPITMIVGILSIPFWLFCGLKILSL